MKYIRQLSIILLITFIGEILHAALPFPVPAGIYGLMLMLALLLTGVLKLEQVEASGQFLVSIMPVMFIPSAAGLIDSWPMLQEFLLPFLLVTLISTWIVMGVSGRITQAIVTQKERR